MLEIDVDVGRFAPLRRDETLEQQIGTVGIDLGDAEAKADGGIGGRAAALAEDFLRAGKAHDVVDGEEIGRIAKLRDQLEFMLDRGAHLVGQALRIASGGAFIGEMRQRVLRVVEACDGLVGIFVTQLVERESQRLAQAQRLFNRFRRVAKQPRHFIRGFKKSLGIGAKFAPGAVDGGLLADAGQHVGERAAAGMVIMHVVDRDQRHVRCARHLFEPRQPGAVLAAIEHGRRQPHAAGRGVTQLRQQARQRRRFAAHHHQFQSPHMRHEIVEMQNAFALLPRRLPSVSRRQSLPHAARSRG